MNYNRLNFLLFGSFVLLAVFVFFSTPKKTSHTYHKDVAMIFDKHCVACHHEGGAGGFSLDNYEDIAQHSGAIKEVVSNKYMPPWKADPTYRHFPGERVLAKTEIKTITEWIDQGAPLGDPTNNDRKPTSRSGTYDPIPDFEFSLGDSVCVEPNTHDYYVSYPIFLHNTEPLSVKDFELRVGNKKIMHHAWIFILDRKKVYELYPSWKQSSKPLIRNILDSPFQDQVMFGYLLYLPGKTNLLHVKGTSKTIPPDAVLVVDLHYFNKQKNTPECDKSVLLAYSATKKETRAVNFITLEEFNILDKEFILPADSVIDFVMSYTFDADFSLLKITPHMHYLGKKIKAFAVTPKNDTIRLIKIDDWDFNWQETYSLSPVVKLPKGTTVWATATFDNTVNNVMNPSIPPVEVRQGFRSKDEMFQIGLELMPYEKGDEYLKPE